MSKAPVAPLLGGGSGMEFEGWSVEELARVPTVDLSNGYAWFSFDPSKFAGKTIAVLLVYSYKTSSRVYFGTKIARVIISAAGTIQSNIIKSGSGALSIESALDGGNVVTASGGSPDSVVQYRPDHGTLQYYLSEYMVSGTDTVRAFVFRSM